MQMGVDMRESFLMAKETDKVYRTMNFFLCLPTCYCAVKTTY